MASIVKRGPYQFDAAIRRKGYPHQFRRFATREEAEVWAAEIELEMRRGAFVERREAQETSLKDALARYKEEVSPHKKGHRWEKNRIDRLMRQPLALRPIGEIRPQDVAAYRDSELARGLASNTVRLDLALLSHVYRTCQTEWNMAFLSNPVKHTRKPKPSRERDRRVTPEELGLIEARAPTHLRRVVLFLIETGMRRSEVCGLRWSDVRGRGAYLVETKGGGGRVVPLSRKALAILEEVALDRGRQGLVFGWRPDTLSHEFREFVLATGIDDLRLHDLRHEYVSRLFEKGVDPVTAAKMTGHKSMQMLKRYLTLSVDALADKLDD